MGQAYYLYCICDVPANSIIMHFPISVQSIVLYATCRPTIWRIIIKKEVHTSRCISDTSTNIVSFTLQNTPA